MSEMSSPQPPWTILKLIRWTKGFFEERGIESARLDAEVLLAHLLDLERIELYAQFDRPLEADELARYRALVKRRANREPVAYLTGHREFWSLDFLVDQRVLIPRPDTETLVRASLERIDEKSGQTLVDVGTGCGAIAVAIATERPELRVGATDNSSDALEVAKKNVDRLAEEREIELFEGDLLEGLPDDWLPLDFIVSNPPYVADGEAEQLEPEVVDYEPASALFAGAKGLDVVERLVATASRALRPGGWLLFEMGYQQGDAARRLLKEEGFSEIEVITDYGDRDRVAAGRKREAPP